MFASHRSVLGAVFFETRVNSNDVPAPLTTDGNCTDRFVTASVRAGVGIANELFFFLLDSQSFYGRPWYLLLCFVVSRDAVFWFSFSTEKVTALRRCVELVQHTSGVASTPVEDALSCCIACTRSSGLYPDSEGPDLLYF